MFIPRPETEDLVGVMLRDEIVRQSQHFVEIGTGSGAIAISLLAELPLLQCYAFNTGLAAFDLTFQSKSWPKIFNFIMRSYALLSKNIILTYYMLNCTIFA